MFLAREGLEQHKCRIRELLANEPSIAVVAAAAYFEWTLSRGVLFLSRTPNSQLRAEMSHVYGLSKYKDLWKAELTYMADFLPLAKVVRNWAGLCDAFEARNALVHGRNRATRRMAEPWITDMLVAAGHVRAWCQSHGAALDERMPVRRRRDA